MSDIEANRVNELAEILPVHVMRLGNLNTGLSLTAWNKISNDILEAATLLRALDDAQARIKQLEEALALGQIVMDLLDKYGAPIVPHLIDTDENVGERFRRALARRLT